MAHRILYQLSISVIARIYTQTGPLQGKLWCNQRAEWTRRNQNTAHGSCFGNAHLRLIDVRIHHYSTTHLTATDRLIDDFIGAEVNVSKRDRVALERLEVIQATSAIEYTHMRPRKGQAVSKLLCFLD